MKFVKYFNFENNDPVKTEENILKNLKKDTINSDFIVADCSFVYLINNNGLRFTQEIINKYLKHENIIFICQHISGINLNWGHGKVFSPHASKNDNFIPIPHYAVNYNKNIIEFDKRKIECSFVGSFDTHSTRSLIYQVYKDNKEFLLKDTGDWHFLNQENFKEREEFYVDSLKNSKYVLCPRGTGPGSIRFWEVLASKCVPILISNEIKIPKNLLEDIIVINQYQDILLIDKLIKINKKINKKRLFETYDKTYNNENMHKIIIDFIKKTA